MSAPWDKIAHRINENLEDEVARLEEGAVGDSPIEKIFFAALLAELKFGSREHGALVFNYSRRGYDEALFDRASWKNLDVVIMAQVRVADWPVDFVVYAPTPDGKWVPAAIECDGHDFHERTREQAARDRSRDRKLQEKGYRVFRFTGSELWRDPCARVDEILEWACDVAFPRPIKSTVSGR